jgi:hypothetical protein
MRELRELRELWELNKGSTSREGCLGARVNPRTHVGSRYPRRGYAFYNHGYQPDTRIAARRNF